MTLLVLLDLSAAFDTVNHEILLRRLETTGITGITGRELQWFSSYLCNRSQRVVFGDGVSESFYLACGVPQGSCLDPCSLLCTPVSYSTSSSTISRPRMLIQTTHNFTYLSSQIAVLARQTAFSAMEKCIRAVRAWMIQDKMKLNDDKTEFLIIGTSQQLKKVRIDTPFCRRCYNFTSVIC